MSHRRGLDYALLSYIIDIGCTLLALLIAQQLRGTLSFGPDVPIATHIPRPVIGLTVLIWSTVFFVLSVYDPRRTYRAVDEFQNVFVATSFSLLVLAGTLYFSYRSLSRILIAYFYGIDIVFLFGWRIVARIIFRLLNGRTYRSRHVIIIGANGLGKKAAQMIRKHEWTGLDLLGFLDDDTHEPVEGLPIIGSLDETHDVVTRHDVEEVVIALPYRSYPKLNQIIADLQILPVQVRIVPDYLSLALYQANAENFGGLPLISLRDPALTEYQRIIKRAFDLFVGACMLISTLPLMAMIAAAIKIDSKGPVLFRQERIGENGRRFIMYKFRSMIVNAEKRRKDVLQYDGDGNVVHKSREDPRVTRIGQFIRRTSLDELPQLINVLKGDMSLVGPRPELPWLVEQYEPWQRQRFAVPQGITGWWQVNGRSNKPMHLNTEYDLHYIQNYSLLLDIKILWKTLAVVFRQQGAY